MWTRLGGGSLSISLVLHGILLVIGVVWVLQIIPSPPEKLVDFMPKSGGGGSPASQAKTQQHQVKMMQSNMARVSAVGATSSMVLPEPVEVSQMASMGSLSSGALSEGLGGAGSGGGLGTGRGTGVGSGLAPGLSNGNGSMNPFGMMNTDDSGALIGTFYDLKQTRAGTASGVDTPSKVQQEIIKFTNHGWHESVFNDFYKAKQTLYQTKLFIPMMEAAEAPAAFNCAAEVQPSRWIVVYRGIVTPPKTGRYRFVGVGDDILVVRFNNKNVFDHGYFSGTVPIYIEGRKGALQTKGQDPAFENEVRRDYPMDLPLKTYQYESTKTYNTALAGLGIGPWFGVRQGQEYPIEILMSELPGGKFGSVLLIEEKGADYKMDTTGAPILPIFRLDGSAPEATEADNTPPYDRNGPVWKVRGNRGKPEI